MKNLGLLFALVFPVVVLAQTGQISVRVTDFDSGGIITNAEVNASFNTSIEPGWGWGGGRPNREKGFTDTNGMCTLTGKGNGGSVGVSAFKAGYYGSAGYSVRFTNVIGTIQKTWQPWNPMIEVVLKRIGKPIPMYAKWVRGATIPSEGQPVGFDLMKGDWVAPYGKGETADFIFTLSRKIGGKTASGYQIHDTWLTITFSDDGDGIQSTLIPPRGGGSALRLSREAPEANYVTNLAKNAYEHVDKSSAGTREDQNYFFRVRTKMDDKRNVVSVLYGKIHGDFSDFYYGKITFKYYLNPTPNHRNMEFDPKRNLFKDLKSVEEVREP